MIGKEESEISAWESYYASLEQIPKRLKQPTSFIDKALPTFRRQKIKRVLDLGCGAGRSCIHMAKEGLDVIGVDVSRSALKLAKKWAREEGLKNTAFLQATMTYIPFKDTHLDAVISVSVLHHAFKRDIEKTIAEIYRILRKNGIFLANIASVRDPRYGDGQKVEPDTFKILESFADKRFEELHHFFAKDEASELVTNFAASRVDLLRGGPNYWKITATK
jgi:ubiquinone/menaquinone biosynthesis C-methylase UbiE